jgi:hypothetical protein
LILRVTRIVRKPLPLMVVEFADAFEPSQRPGP